MRHESTGAQFVTRRTDSIDCEEAELFVSRRIDGELEPADFALLKAHLKCCEKCRAQAQAWAETNCVLTDSISSMWTDDTGVSARVPSHDRLKTLPTPQRRCHWVPLSMLASQTAAIVGLAAYLLFFSSRAEAPQKSTKLRPQPPAEMPRVESPAPIAMSSSQPRTPEIPAEKAHAVATKIDEPKLTTPTPIVVSEKETVAAVAEAPANQNTTDEPQPVAAVETHTPAPIAAPVRPEPVILAAPRPPVMPKLIPNVSMDFEIGDHAGRLTLLGDVLSGRAVIRITDNEGKMQEFAQADVDTLVPEPQRSAVRRFLAACASPALRSRFAEFQK